MHKTITWTKKIGKGWQEWHKACLNTTMPCKSSRFQWNQVCFLNHFVSKYFRIQAHHCLVLWKATIIDTSRPCAKSTSLGQIHKPKFLWILWVPWCNNVGWTKIEVIGYFPIPLLHQFHLYVKCGWIAWYLIPLRPMTLMLSFNTCKKSCISFEALPFIYAFFSISKS